MEHSNSELVVGIRKIAVVADKDKIEGTVADTAGMVAGIGFAAVELLVEAEHRHFLPLCSEVGQSSGRVPRLEPWV